MTKSAPAFLNVHQAALELGLARRSVVRRISNGDIEATKIGPGRTSAYIISRDEIERAKASARATKAAP